MKGACIQCAAYCYARRTQRGLYAGSSVDERDARGYTALMMAVRCRNYAEAAVLLDHGHASTALRDDEYHRTAVDWAELSVASESAPYPERSTRYGRSGF